MTFDKISALFNLNISRFFLSLSLFSVQLHRILYNQHFPPEMILTTLSNYRLDWQLLLPDITTYSSVFANAAQQPAMTFAKFQPRLNNSLALFCHMPASFMLLKADSTSENLALIYQATKQQLPALTLQGSQYHIDDDQVSIMAATAPDNNFAATSTALFADWFEAEQLFGTARLRNNTLHLTPGLVHQANGGVLILSLRTLLAQPLLWLRLKQAVTTGKFIWHSPNQEQPLPFSIPDMPIHLKILLVSDREGLADFEELEPEICRCAVYGELEQDMPLQDVDDMQHWCAWVSTLATEYQLPAIHVDAWPSLIKEAIRFSGDQGVLPLDILFISQLLRETATLGEENAINASTVNHVLSSRRWRASYLPQRLHDEIEQGQIRIETHGEVIGQINGLSVMEYPGYPYMIGEPSRISCVAHFGDGEFIDVERKVELGGNLHAKGMMIMQAFLIAELELEQQLPFSISSVFEQSYSEVDGDSASLAELCALISTLSLVPINQQIAVTGSVDQFGHVQPIGGVNEKIEGFFEVCQRRGLSGQQGVILPLTNVRHLCLNDDVIDAVRRGEFHLWAIENAEDALPLLTGKLFRSNEEECLLNLIRQRILLANNSDKKPLPWPLRWLSGLYRG